MNKFKEWREQSGLTQQEISDELGFETRQMVSNIERGVSVYSPKLTKKLAKIFKVSEREVKTQIYLFREKQLRKKLGL